MEDQLISFEVAKIAKDKGFEISGNGYCSKFYVLKDYTHVHHTLVEGFIDEEYTDETCCEVNSVKLQDRLYPATQSLLQKWLREVHNISVEVSWGRNLSNDILYWSYELSRIMWEFRDIVHNNHKFVTYEQALEKGLEKALKLI